MVLTRLQRFLLFPAHRPLPMRDPAAHVRDLEKLWLDTDEGPVEAWLMRAKQPGPRPLIVYAHGNGELIDYWPDMLEPYRALGCSVLMPEYRGYGRSAGKPSQEAITRDFVAFYDRITALPEIDASRVVLHGRSLGGGVVAQLAAKRPCVGIFLQSTFTSVHEVASQWLVPKALVWDRFETSALIADFDVPILIWHGKRDGLIPYTHAQRNARKARRARLILDEGTHNDCPTDWDFYWSELERFLRVCDAVQP